MKSSRSSGSAHIILIIALVIALIGALGFIFWNNLNQNPVVKNDPSSVTGEKTPEIKLLKACLEIEKMCFDYPEDWTIKMSTNPDKDFPGDNATLTSKNGFMISVQSGITGIGGTCDPATAGTMIVVDTNELSIDGYGTGDRAAYESEKLHAAKIIHVNQEQTEFRPSLLLTTSLGLTSKGTKAGCEVGYAALFEGKKAFVDPSGIEYSGLVSFGESNNANEYGAPSTTEAEASERLESTEFKGAYKILTSVRYE